MSDSGGCCCSQDWGMTAVSYYRELFPLFVAELFTAGRLGLSARGAMSALTVTPRA